MEHTLWTLSVLKVLTLLVGATFLFIASRAYRKHRTRPLWVLIVAVSLMTLASLAEGAAYQILHLSLEQAHVVEAVFMLAAFVVLLWSVLVPDRRHSHERLQRRP